MNNYETLRAKYSEQKATESDKSVERPELLPPDVSIEGNESPAVQTPTEVDSQEQGASTTINPEYQIQEFCPQGSEQGLDGGAISENADTPIENTPKESQLVPLDEEEKMNNDESAKELAELNQNIRQANASLTAVLQALSAQATELQAIRQAALQPNSATEHIQKLAGSVDELKINAARHEKANVDILRDSKNFQASVREQMQRELDGYHKLHSSTAYAPILTEIANLYITTQKAISYVADPKVREHFNDLVLESISELLTDQGVEIHSTDVGEARSLRTCKTRKTIPTGDKALHGLVAASNHPSFSLGNLVLIKESIDTYVYDASLDSNSNENEATTPEELTE